ncbi:MAG: thiol-disulfide isomerase [Bryobacterales bacterium]|nr:thiol-disulfide isomerase [Bryobacterales bacterium]
MALETYVQVRPWARAIRETVLRRKMPPWFAVAGTFANDPSLTREEIAAIEQWADGKAPEGKPVSRGRAISRAEEPPAPDWAMRAPAVRIPAKTELEYQYIILGEFGTDQWVRRVEVRPSDRRAVHHLVVYARAAGSAWLAGRPKNQFFTARPEEGATTADILGVYTPGTRATELPEGMARRVRAGSEIVLQIHYNPYGREAKDASEVRLWFSKTAPRYNVLTLQLNQPRILIPPFARDHVETVSGTMPGDALLLNFLPHLHLRGKSFEYRIVAPGGRAETLLKVSPYDFYWQLQYWLATPRLLKKGTRLQAEAHWDNSAANAANPDPSAEVTYCEPSRCEMMVGFFDVAVGADVDKESFFLRR